MPPDLRSVFSDPARFTACGVGSGLSAKFPGTAGTLAECLHHPGLAGRAWAPGIADHGVIVRGEMVPFWLVLLLTPPALAWQALASLWSRIFDIVKLPPVRRADRRLGGRPGVTLDDLLAAGYTLPPALLKRLLD